MEKLIQRGGKVLVFLFVTSLTEFLNVKQNIFNKFNSIFIFLIILIFIVGIVTSKIKINIYELKYSNTLTQNNLKYLTKVKIYLFNKIPLIQLRLNDKKIKAINKIDKNLLTNPIQAIKKLKLKINSVNLKVNIGVENVILTSMVITLISAILSVILSKTGISASNSKYEINPIYNINNKLFDINVNLNCEFEIKIYHIITINALHLN